jgi:hypothetical protein
MFLLQCDSIIVFYIGWITALKAVLQMKLGYGSYRPVYESNAESY